MNFLCEQLERLCRGCVFDVVHVPVSRPILPIREASIICVVALAIILGSSFTVFILGPATVLTAAATLAVGFANADFRVAIFATLAMLASLQVGYVTGALAAAYLSKTPGSTWESWRYF
jgi:hypothetical protein